MTKRYAPATNRNREPILAVLKQYIPSTGNILEIASGTGEHSIFFAPHFVAQQWIPSDLNPDALASINAWRQDCPTNNLQPPLTIDVTIKNWYEPFIDRQITSSICINMIHIAPWSAFLGLVEGVSKILPTSGIFYLYGPYKINNQHTAMSNEQFDASLRSRNPQWGIRNLETVSEVAQENNLHLKAKVAMPANNFSLIFTKV